MTKTLARQTILVLCAKRIPFKLRKDSELFHLIFDAQYQRAVTQSLGANNNV